MPGGVTVCYFEWVKNLSHIRFGRMQRREEEARNRMLIEELENTAGITISEKFKAKYINGADELTLVRSGLDDTMRGAYATCGSSGIRGARRIRTSTCAWRPT